MKLSLTNLKRFGRIKKIIKKRVERFGIRKFDTDVLVKRYIFRA